MVTQPAEEGVVEAVPQEKHHLRAEGRRVGSRQLPLQGFPDPACSPPLDGDNSFPACKLCPAQSLC